MNTTKSRNLAHTLLIFYRKSKQLTGMCMPELLFNTKDLVTKNQIPTDAKLLPASITDYRIKLPGEKIIKNCASTGEYTICDNNLFYQADNKGSSCYQVINGNFKLPVSSLNSFLFLI